MDTNEKKIIDYLDRQIDRQRKIFGNIEPILIFLDEMTICNLRFNEMLKHMIPLDEEQSKPIFEGWDPVCRMNFGLLKH